MTHACPHRKVRPLGEGAVGDVHLCVDVFGRRLVVVKWIRAELQQSKDTNARFLREAELMATWRFEGVIRVEQHGVDETGRTWMAMEFVDGLNPASVIAPGDAWAVHRLLAGVGRSLDQLHGLGVVHRDLKLDNILLRNRSDGWEPVIFDLGIAKWLSLDTSTATGSVFGTPHYMSPEQFRDTKHVGPATDRYALAVIAYELLSGHLPYDGRSLPELLRQHVELPVPELRLHVLVSTRCLDAFVRRAMAKTPEQRFQSSAELADAFREAACADGLWSPPEIMRTLFDPLDRPIVEVMQDASPAMQLDVREGPIVLGRHEACQVVITSPRASRQHACIFGHRGRLWLADLNSQNQTQCFGRLLSPGVPVPLPTDGRPTQVVLYDQTVQIRTLTA